MWFFNWHTAENLVVSNKDNSVYCLGTIGLMVALWNLMFLKLAYLPSKLRFSGKYLY